RPHVHHRGRHRAGAAHAGRLAHARLETAADPRRLRRRRAAPARRRIDARPGAMQRRSTATFIGFAAIAMWSLLSLLTVASGTVPPFQLAAMTFAIGGGIGAATWLLRPHAVAALRQPPEVWALGVGGLFGYHALFFIALRLAPPAEAQLVNYVWPLFIVLGSALLPGERLKSHHVLGALVALAGTVVLFVGRDDITFAGAYLPGFACAFGAAVIWAVYSVLSRRFAAVPTDA